MLTDLEMKTLVRPLIGAVPAEVTENDIIATSVRIQRLVAMSEDPAGMVRWIWRTLFDPERGTFGLTERRNLSMRIVRCQTMHCENEATGTLVWAGSDGPIFERACAECAASYLRRPAIQCMFFPDALCD